MSYFIYNGVNSNNYGIAKFITYPVRAERSLIVTEIPDGEPIIQQSGYKTSNISIRLGLRDNSPSNIDDIYSWLSGSGQLILSSDTSKYIRAVCNGPLSPEYISRKLSELTVSFTCQPFRYSLNNPEIILTLNDSAPGQKNVTVQYAGNHEGKPKIKVITTGDFTLWINGAVYISVVAGAGTYTIDLANSIVYNASGAVILDKVVGDLTALKMIPGSNIITVTSQITAMSIVKNERWK